MFSYTVLSNETSDLSSLSGWRKFLLASSPVTILANLVLAFFMITNLVLNGKVIYILCRGIRGHRMRNVSLRLLIVQISVISIGYIILKIYLIVEQLGFLEYRNEFRCKLSSFVKTVLICGLSTNMAAIFYDKTRIFDDYQTSTDLLIYRLLLLVWIPAVVQGLPDLFSATIRNNLENVYSSSSVNNCVSVVFFGSAIFFGLIEMIKFLIFNIGLSYYMIKVMLSIRSQLLLLYNLLPNAQRRLANKISTTRFLCIHLVAFITIWIPAGFLSLIIRIVNLVTFSQEENNSSNNLYTSIIVFTYLSLNSSINLTHVQNNMRIWPKWSYCWCICLPQRTFRDINLQRAHADIVLPTMVRPRPREERRIESTSRHSTGVMSAYDIRSSATSMLSQSTRRVQATVSMIDIVGRARQTSESREISSENETSETSVGMLKETLV